MSWLPWSSETTSLLAERVLKECLQLRQMLRHHAGRGRCRSRPSRVTHALVLGVDMRKHPLQIGIDERPRTHVLGLFLAPGHFRVAEARQLVDQRLGREGIELLD